MIEQQFNHHPGVLRIESLPSTDEHAEALWNWAKSTVMFWFGPYEDAMTIEHTTLFHTTISSLLNLNRLQAKTVVNEAIALDIPFIPRKALFDKSLDGENLFVMFIPKQTVFNPKFQKMRRLSARVQDGKANGPNRAVQ